jgi:2-amino-4-hydroxy-6-hydroxymethyldihydropteridine diphosphokinase
MLQPCLEQSQPKLAIIGLGANLLSDIGKPEETIRHSLSLLIEKSIEIQSVSQLYNTPCFPKGSGPDYVNAVAILTTYLTAPAFLSHLHAIEALMGRQRLVRWGQRVLDLDLLAFGDEISPDLASFQQWYKLSPDQQVKIAPEQLILPHPRLQDRAFVLVPLTEIAPDWQHPVLQRSARQLLAGLDRADVAQIVPI